MARFLARLTQLSGSKSTTSAASSPPLLPAEELLLELTRDPSTFLFTGAGGFCNRDVVSVIRNFIRPAWGPMPPGVIQMDSLEKLAIACSFDELPGGMHHPDGIALVASGSVFVCDYGGGAKNDAHVLEFQMNGHFVGVAVAAHPELSSLMSVALLPTGTMILAENGNDSVVEYERVPGQQLWQYKRTCVPNPDDPFDVHSWKGKTEKRVFSCTQDVCVTPSGDIWATCLKCRITVLSSESLRPIARYACLGGADDELLNPAGIAVNPVTGDIAVADLSNNRVVIRTTDGTVKAILDHKRPTKDSRVKFSEPNRVAFDAAGNLVVADSGHGRLCFFSPDLALIGTYPSGAMTPSERSRSNPEFFPAGICVGPRGEIFVVNRSNKRVLVLDVQ